MALSDIFNAIVVGETIQMHFGTKKDAEDFRIALAKYKTKQFKIMEALEITNPGARMMLCFKLENSLLPEAPYIATIYLRERPDNKYDFVILDGKRESLE